MRRFPLALWALILQSVLGGTITLTDDARGWVTPNPPPPVNGGTTGDAPPNNGTAADNNYSAGGSQGGGIFRNWFEFAIPSLDGPLLAATISLDQPSLDVSSEFLLGGLDSGEIDYNLPPCNGCGQNFDFAATGGAPVALTLDTADPAPEPSTLAACLCAAALRLSVRRHHTRAPAARAPRL